MQYQTSNVLPIYVLPIYVLPIYVCMLASLQSKEDPNQINQ